MTTRAPRPSLSPYTTLFRSMTEKLLTYALGRSLTHYDMPAVRAIVRNAAKDGYRFSSIAREIARSTPFTMRRPDAAPRSEEHTSEIQSQSKLVCRLLLETKQ